MLDALIGAGIDIVRLNFAARHARQRTTPRSNASVRRLARAQREVRDPPGSRGPKIRTGGLEGERPLALKPGDVLRIATGDFVGGSGRVSTTFDGLARGVKPGDRLLLADGLIELRVERTPTGSRSRPR